MKQRIADYFKLEQSGTTIKTEFFAGMTTFLAMAYILSVNSDMLASTGMNVNAVFTATAIAAIAGTLIMGLLANYPIALAPGMGMNAYFAFTIVGVFAAMGISQEGSWKLALAAIFISGAIFLLISLSGWREKIINAIPQDLKYAVGGGIGLFIAFLGFQNAGIIVGGPTLVQLGNFSSPAVILSIVGLILTVILYIKRVPAAIFLSIIITAILGIIGRYVLSSSGVSEELLINLPVLPEGIMSWPSAPHFGAFLDGFTFGQWSDMNFIFSFIIVIFTLLFMDFFDTAGTLVTVGSRCGLINEKGELHDSGKALAADAAATVIGAVAGTSSTTSFVESLSGVEAGGRTGLTSVFTALGFVIALFFSPIFLMVTGAVTAPALIMVGILMATQLGKIAWDDLAIAIPAFLTIIIMPLAYSIAEGIAVGFVFYPITMVAAKRGKEVSKIMYGLSVVFLIYFIIKGM